MFTISVKHDFQRFAATIDRLRRDQLPYAVARALTDTAQAARRGVTEQLPSIFDRPTPFTMRALTIIAARKERQFAVVTLHDIQARYLLPEEIGGERTAAMNTLRPARALVEPGADAATRSVWQHPERHVAPATPSGAAAPLPAPA